MQMVPQTWPMTIANIWNGVSSSSGSFGVHHSDSVPWLLDEGFGGENDVSEGSDEDETRGEGCSHPLKTLGIQV